MAQLGCNTSVVFSDVNQVIPDDDGLIKRRLFTNQENANDAHLRSALIDQVCCLAFFNRDLQFG